MDVNITRHHPRAYEAMRALGQAAEEAASSAELDSRLVELVRIRVAQLNGCAFCLRLHTRHALELGETTDRLSVLAAWWESEYFSETECAALALAEAVTRLPVPDPHEWDTGVLSDEQVSALSWIAIAMNAWTRIAVRSHYPVAP